MAAWDTQIRYYTRKSIEIEYVVDSMLEENVHDILCSALVDDCIERAKASSRAARSMTGCPACRWASPTSATAAAVKKLVFEQGVIGQQQLAAALADDFDGLTHEQLRQRLINGAPKYGNDDDSVDLLLTRAYETYIEELKQYHNPRYGRGPIGVTTTRARRLSQQTCRLAQRPWRRRTGVRRIPLWRKGPARLPVPTTSGRRR